MKLFSATLEDLSASLDHLQKALDIDCKVNRQLPSVSDVRSATGSTLGFRRHLEATQDYITRVETLLHQAAGEARTH